MFIKIKLERQNEAEMDYIEIAEDISLSEITQKLQSYIKVPADDMEIRTLGKVYKQHDKFKSIWEKERKEGCVVMLYTYNSENDDEAQFFCFLQLFETEAALEESCRSVKHRPVRQISNATSKSSDVTIVANLVTEDEDDDEEDGNEKQTKNNNTDAEGTTSSESTTTESDSSDSSDDSAVCRRSKASKRPLSSHSNMPKKLAKNLDEFPCYHTESRQSTKPDTTTHNSPKSQINTALENEAVIAKKISDAGPKEKCISAVTSPTFKATTYTVPETMTMNISPETREFIILVLKTTDDCIQQNECLPILNVFFKQFYDSQSEQVAALKFNDTDSPFKLHEGKLWIICEDEITFGWIIEQIGNQLPATYRAEKFRNHFQLIHYNVVIPNVCGSKDMLIVFQLLQKQNAHVDMSLWTVAQRREISGGDDEHYDNTVCNFCVNEMLTIGIDQANAELLGESFTLKYCFWKLQFKLDNSKQSK